MRYLFIISLLIVSCQSKEEKGEVVFEQNCSSCHNFRANSIGPQLGGVAEAAPADWIKNFIKDPKGMIESADAKGRRWSTIGVSPNIVDASYNALYDAITYKLFRDGAAPATGGQGSGTVGSTARPA